MPRYDNGLCRDKTQLYIIVCRKQNALYIITNFDISGTHSYY